MSLHAKEPWRYTGAEFEGGFEGDDETPSDEGYPISGAQVYGADGDSIFTLDVGDYAGLSDETAARIVACVNACAGVHDVVLASVSACGGFSRDTLVQHVTAERDAAISRVVELVAKHEALLDALHLALPFVEDHEGDAGYKPGIVAKAVGRIRSVIDNAGAKS